MHFYLDNYYALVEKIAFSTEIWLFLSKMIIFSMENIAISLLWSLNYSLDSLIIR